MNDFVTNNHEIEYEDGVDPDDENNYDSVINHIQIRNKLNAELDELSSSDNPNENEEEKEMELIDNVEETPKEPIDEKEQQLLKELTKSNKTTKTKRYFDLLTDGNHKGFMLDDDSDESDDDDSSSSDSDDEYEDSSDDDEDEDGDNDEMNVDESEDEDEDGSSSSGDSEEEEVDEDEDESEDDSGEIKKDGLSELSKLEFEKLLSHTMVNLALKLEENENENMSKMNNPFANMDDEISLDTNNNQLNMKDLLSFINDDMFNDGKNNNIKDNTNMDINDPKNFESVIPFEKSHNILPEPKTSSSNHPSNLRRSKLNNMTLSSSKNAKNTFIREEERLAEKLS